MLSNFLDKSKPINYIIIIGLFCFYFAVTLFNSIPNQENISSFLGNKGLCLLLFLITFFFVNFITTKNKLTEDNSYLFFFFVILTGLFQETISLSKILFTNIILLLFFRNIYHFKKAKKISKVTFDSAFWLGVCFLIEPLTIFFTPLLITAISVYQKLNVRSILIVILGFIIPTLLTFTYFFWMDELDVFYQLINLQTDYKIPFYFKLKEVIITCIITFLLLAFILLKSIKIFNIKDDFKKCWTLIITQLLITICFLLFIDKENGKELIYIFFPTALILANGVELIQRKWLKNLILFLFLITSITLTFITNSYISTN